MQFLGRKFYFQNHKSENAGVIVELTFVVPVLLILMAGALSIGRVISQLAWMSQSAFQVYLTGAENANTAERLGAIQGRWTKLYDGNNGLAHGGHGSRAMIINSSDVGSNVITGNMLTVRIAGVLPTIFGDSSIFPLSVSVTGPMLAPDTSSTNLGQPENPKDTNNVEIPWGCDGRLGPTSQTCFTCSASTCQCIGLIPVKYDLPCRW